MKKLGSRWRKPKSIAGYCCLHRVEGKPQAMSVRQIKAKDCINLKKRGVTFPCPRFKKRLEHPFWN